MIGTNRVTMRAIMCVCLALVAFVAVRAEEPTAKSDIRKLSQHFIDAKNSAPWTFLPAENIKELSLSEHPGIVTIREAGKGQDIKGVLENPIRLDEYPPPWEFHVGIMQNALAMKGLSEQQINYAIGLNLAVTFSDPKTWPRDRTKRPDDVRSLQLFVVHLGNQGENYRPGVPAVRHSALNMGDHSPEAYLFYGRGDLAPTANGNWNFPYSWVGPDPTDAGTWSKRGGPADTIIRFRVSVTSDSSLEIGAGYGDHPGWRMRNIDVSRFGRITGIWEIGPVISLDRWIPDVLAKELAVAEPPAWLTSFGGRQKVLGDTKAAQTLQEQAEKLFAVEPPDARFAYYIDYATFYANGPDDIEQLSEDFDNPGFLADQKYYVEGNGVCETHSNPGHMTVTLFGHNSSWAMCPILRAGAVDFSIRKPPFEIETSFIGPGDAAPWNLWWNVGVFDEQGKLHTWQPGLKFMPGKGTRYFDTFTLEPDDVALSKEFGFEFPTPLPELPAGEKPITMRIEIPDEHHLRIGFRSEAKAPWTFSSTYDSRKSFGRIAKFAYPCLVSFQGRGVGAHGWGAGNYPNYQKFKIDYVHFRYALTK